MRDITVYSLTNLSTGLIFYVGMTFEPKTRLSAHKAKFGKNISFDELEVVKSQCGMCGAGTIEKYWIYQLKEWGFPIINRKRNSRNCMPPIKHK